MTKQIKAADETAAPVTLKMVAQHVGLTAGTISAILNRAPQARSIPQSTKDRVLAAASLLNYRPNPFARALRQRGAHASAVAKSANKPGVLVFDRAEDFQRAVDAIRQAGIKLRDDGTMAEKAPAAF